MRVAGTLQIFMFTWSVAGATPALRADKIRYLGTVTPLVLYFILRLDILAAGQLEIIGVLRLPWYLEKTRLKLVFKKRRS